MIFSFRNEESVLPELIRRTEAALQAVPSYEILFVDDDSSDRSFQILTDHKKNNPAIKILRMKHRYGVIPCFWAGLEHASGEAVITLDADLQDPPEIFPEMIKKWQAGAQIVYAVRKRRLGESRFKQGLTWLAYRLIHWLAPWDVPLDAGEFRLTSRQAVAALLKIKMPKPYLRALVPSLGFTSASIVYDRQPRFSGSAHFPLCSLSAHSPAATFFSAITSILRLRLRWIETTGPHYELSDVIGFSSLPVL